MPIFRSPIVAGLIGAAAPLPALAQAQSGPVSCMSYFWDGGWGHMFFGGFMMLLFWATLIALIALAVRWVVSSGSGSWPSSRTTAKQILEERFARGEISKEEFEERKRALAV